MSITNEDRQKDQKIRAELRQVSDQVRAKHPWLVEKQNQIGMAILLVSCAGILLNAALYISGYLPAWAVIVLTAFWTSLLHELEHDLIHLMYFRSNRAVYNFMMLGVYLFRPLTQNPWVRRYLHHHHHQSSGTETDLEERAITNGERWNLGRLLMTGDLMLGFYLRIHKFLTEPRRLFREGKITKKDLKNYQLISLTSYTPLGLIAYAIWHGFLLFHMVNGIAWLAGASIPWPAWLLSQQGWVTTVVVVLLAPNFFRMFCLHFISSNLHYYGDNKAGVIHEQCQVLNKWYFIPFQVFCFNFGATHVIHHFLVRDPFYIRQLTEKASHEVLRKYDIPFNDLGTFKRANRLHGLTAT